MTKTQITKNPRPNYVAAIIEKDGESFGRVIARGSTYTATRKTGQVGVDIRRMAGGFQSVGCAVAWVEAAG